LNRSVIYTLLVAVCLLMLYYFLSDDIPLHPSFVIDVCFFAALSLLMGSWKNDHQNTKASVQLSLAMVVVRLIVAILLLFVLVWFYDGEAVPVSLNLVGVYLVFMVFDMILALANLRRN